MVASLATCAVLASSFLVVFGPKQCCPFILWNCGNSVVHLGSALGIWAANNDTVSAILQSTNDTLQTMPLLLF